MTNRIIYRAYEIENIETIHSLAPGDSSVGSCLASPVEICLNLRFLLRVKCIFYKYFLNHVVVVNMKTFSYLSKLRKQVRVYPP